MLKGSVCLRAAACCYSTLRSSRVISRLPVVSSFGVIDKVAPSIRGELRNIPSLASVTADVASTAPQLCISPNIISVVNFPIPNYRREIVDPLLPLRHSKEPPPRPHGPGEISLPELIEKEMVDPSDNVIEKRAARLIVIRRAKMKKHKWRKLQKKMKFEFARRRQKRELKKEKAFQALLVGRVKEAEKFNAEAFVARQLETAHWERPITHVRNRRAPDWVIRDHLRELEEQQRINERIEQCLRFKKQ